MSEIKNNENEFKFMNQILKNKELIDESFKFNAYFDLYSEFINNFMEKCNEKEEKIIKIFIEELKNNEIPNNIINKIIKNVIDKLKKDKEDESFTNSNN